MPEKKQDDFKVSDRRLFTAEGELRHDVEEEPAATDPSTAPQTPLAAAPPVSPAPEPSAPPQAGEFDMPPTPSADEQNQQADAYRKSAKDLDTRVELSGHSARELEVTFERFLASLYMSAMLQLGLMHEQGGQPRVDLIAARQSIDTLGLIAEKTKGNLTAAEQNFLQNCLYELRMAYVEVTNALARAPQPAAPGGPQGR
jgi:hypothetical protein